MSLSIQKIEKLETAHGEAAFETCEHCGRQVQWLATLLDGRKVGVDCAETLVLPEELKPLRKRVRKVKELYNALGSQAVQLIAEARVARAADTDSPRPGFDWVCSASDRRTQSARNLALEALNWIG
jgi:hypothetical protein